MCKYILGIDISKSTFDIALLDADDNYVTGLFNNSQHGVRSLRKWLQNRESRNTSCVHGGDRSLRQQSGCLPD